MLGLIGGTGLNQLKGLRIDAERVVETAYGLPSAALQIGQFKDQAMAFLPRHGQGHHIPPHAINYRANLQAFKQVGVTQIIAVAAVGGISGRMAPAELVLPDDIIDYTWGREQTYSLHPDDPLHHVEMTPAYDPALRKALIQAAEKAGVHLRQPAVHGVTQGPRLETAAEVRKLSRDGCDIVGMTGMPEAALAKELQIPYACLAVVVNWAAGIAQGGIHDEIEEHLAQGMGKALKLLEALDGLAS